MIRTKDDDDDDDDDDVAAALLSGCDESALQCSYYSDYFSTRRPPVAPEIDRQLLLCHICQPFPELASVQLRAWNAHHSGVVRLEDQPLRLPLSIQPGLPLWSSRVLVSVRIKR